MADSRPEGAPDSSAFGNSQLEGRSAETPRPQRMPAAWAWLRGLGFGPGDGLAWRLRALAAAALLGCLAVFGLARGLAGERHIDLAAAEDATGSEVLAVTLQGPGQGTMVASRNLLRPATRWQLDAAAATESGRDKQRVAAALLAADGGALGFVHADGLHSTRELRARGWRGLGVAFWPLVAGALLLYLLAAAVFLARPHLRNGLFVLMATFQSAQLVLLAVAALPGFSPAQARVQALLPVAAVGELLGAAVLLAAAGLHPRRLPQAGLWAAGGAAVVVAMALAILLGNGPGFAAPPGSGPVAPPFVAMQAALLAIGAAAAWQAHRSWRDRPDPTALLLRRLIGVALAVGGALTVAVIAAGQWPAAGATTVLALVAPVAWHTLLLAVLLLAPLLARSRQLMREFAMLAGVSAVATSLDLLFAMLFALGPFTSLALAMFAALALYAGLRQWLVARLAGERSLSVERLFEQLYRVARQVQADPAQYPQRLVELLKAVFEPLELNVQPAAGPVSAIASTGCRVQRGGAALSVPLAERAGEVPTQWLELEFAQRGRRLFGAEDARLAERILEQLRRAVAYDTAVERGRSEERLRLAQDLHDDIGARLLTLMYQAPTPELEDYIRHTLQDLKTLTRGLAATEHRLSHAAAEWKSDLAQRLAPARAELDWSFEADAEPVLSVVQWSALTRVLRELVSNALYHGHAGRVEVRLRLVEGTLRLVVADDGGGRNPEAWSHGLGLGGVRKRVRQLGGEVHWRENEPRGIVCEALISGLGSRA